MRFTAIDIVPVLRIDLFQFDRQYSRHPPSPENLTACGELGRLASEAWMQPRREIPLSWRKLRIQKIWVLHRWKHVLYGRLSQHAPRAKPFRMNILPGAANGSRGTYRNVRFASSFPVRSVCRVA